MILNHAPAGILPETNVIRFAYWDGYQHLFEKAAYAWKLKDEVQNWLLVHAPHARAFLDCGHQGQGEPNAHLTFMFKQQAEAFIARWGERQA